MYLLISFGPNFSKIITAIQNKHLIFANIKPHVYMYICIYYIYIYIYIYMYIYIYIYILYIYSVLVVALCN